MKPNDVRLLQTLANSMSVALENARLLEETRRRERENFALLDISRDISSTLDTSTVLEGIANHAHNVLQGDLSGLFLPEEKGQWFRAIAAVGHEAENLKSDPIKIGEGILGSIANDDLLIAFTDGIPDTLNSNGEFFGKEKMLEVLKSNQTPTSFINKMESTLQAFKVRRTFVNRINLYENFFSIKQK